MASRLAAGIFGRTTMASASASRGAVRRLATSATESAENEFLAERAHVKDHAGKSADLWRKVSLYGCIPGAVVLSVYIYGIEKHHYDHALHEYQENDNNPPERVFYEYNIMRKKGFPWGDGSKTIFHNPMVNYPASP